MNQYVTDTMAIVLYLSTRRLAPSVKQIFQSADIGLCTIVIPAIVAVEISYLSEKGRIDVSSADLKQHIRSMMRTAFCRLRLKVLKQVLKSPTFLNCMIG